MTSRGGEMMGSAVKESVQIAVGAQHPEPLKTGDAIGTQVRVRFFTRQPEYHISSSPVLIPTSIRRYELSEIINKILGHDQPVVFEFVLQDQVIRGTLGSHILKNNLGTENILEVEYFSSGIKLTKETVCDYNDWISDLSVSEKDKLVVSASFGGEICIWDFTGNVTASMKSGSQINKVIYLEENKQLVYGDSDCSINLGKYDTGSNLISTFLSGKLESPVTSLHKYRGETMFVNGCSDGSIYLWDIVAGMDDLNTQATNRPPSNPPYSESHRARKRIGNGSRVDASTTDTFSPVMSLPKQHKSSVTCFSFASDSVYSGSLDHKIIQWDLNKGTWIHSTDANHSVLCMDANPSLSVLITGHTNNSINIHDIRTSESSLDIRQIDKLFGKNTHSSWVSQLRWSPSNSSSYPYTFASSSYDGKVKIWDVRALSPIHTINAAPQNCKIFALSWAPPSVIVAGGQECKLKFFY